MHNQSPSLFTLATIGSACILSARRLSPGTPARAAPLSSPDARTELPSRLLELVQERDLDYARAAARGPRGGAVARGPRGAVARGPQGGVAARGGLWRGRRTRPRRQCRGSPGLPAAWGGGRLVSAIVLLVAARRCGRRRRGARLRDGRGCHGLCHLATAGRRLLLVLHQCATYPRLLGRLSAVRWRAACAHHRAITAAASAEWPTGCQRGRPLIGMAAPPKVSLRSAGAWVA